MSQKIKIPAHMRWAYLIADDPMTHCAIARRYAFEALSNLRLPIPEKLANLFRVEEQGNA